MLAVFLLAIPCGCQHQKPSPSASGSAQSSVRDKPAQGQHRPNPAPRPTAETEPEPPPDQPFEPNPEFLDPTHDQAVRRFAGVSPRCAPTDKHCLPMPYNHTPQLVVGLLKSRYKPNAKRTLLKHYQTPPGTNPCSHDGECLFMGGTRCVRWDASVGDHDFLLRGVLLDAYCGCVQKRCQWFTQPRPKILVDVKSVKLNGWPKRLSVPRDELDLSLGPFFQDDVSRCFVDHLKQLPRRVFLSVEQKRDRDQQTGTIKGAPAEVARCIEPKFTSGWGVSLGDVTDAELAQHPITLTATFVVSLKTVP